MKGLELSEGSLIQMVGDWHREEYGWDAAVLAFELWLEGQRQTAVLEALQSTQKRLQEAQDLLPVGTLEEIHALRGYLKARERVSDFTSVLLTAYDVQRKSLKEAQKELTDDPE